MPAWDCAQLGVGTVAVGNSIGDAISDFYIGCARPDCNDGSRPLCTRNIRQRSLVMSTPVKTRTIINVEIVDTCGGNLDQRFARCRFGIVYVFEAKNFGWASFVDPHSFHELKYLSCRESRCPAPAPIRSSIWPAVRSLEPSVRSDRD